MNPRTMGIESKPGNHLFLIVDSFWTIKTMHGSWFYLLGDNNLSRPRKKKKTYTHTYTFTYKKLYHGPLIYYVPYIFLILSQSTLQQSGESLIRFSINIWLIRTIFSVNFHQIKLEQPITVSRMHCDMSWCVILG